MYNHALLNVYMHFTSNQRANKCLAFNTCLGHYLMIVCFLSENSKFGVQGAPGFPPLLISSIIIIIIIIISLFKRKGQHKRHRACTRCLPKLTHVHTQIQQHIYKYNTKKKTATTYRHTLTNKNNNKKENQ